MGGNTSLELNITMMSSIIQCSLQEVENVLLHIEGRPLNKTPMEIYFEDRKLERAREATQKKKEQEEMLREIGADVISPTRSHETATNSASTPFAIGKEELPTYERAVEVIKLNPELYVMTPEQFEDVLNELQFSASDIDIISNLYTLIDRRGFESIDVRVVLIAFCMLLASTSRQYMTIAFQLFDRTGSGLIEKKDLLDITLLANDTLLFFGDKNLKQMQVVDFVDSVFTSAGKIDGEIHYDDYIDTMVDHPIIEMLMAPQFQGNIRSKLTNEASLATIDMSV